MKVRKLEEHEKYRVENRYCSNEMMPVGCDKRSLSPSGERCLRQFDGPGVQLYHIKISFYMNCGAKLHPREVKIMTSS